MNRAEASSMTRRDATPGRHIAGEGGYTLVELLTVLAILGTILGALTGLFVSASRAEVDMNHRFRAQQEARLALDKLRRDAHCASKVTAVGWPAGSVTLTLPVNAYGDQVCPTGAGPITWCAVPVGSGNRFALWRIPGATCTTTGGRQVADYLTLQAIFDYVPQSTLSLAKLRVELPVDTKPSDAAGAYRLRDELALRNTRRVAVTP